MPISDDYRERLYPNLEKIVAHFGTPFHIYDEKGIRETVRYLYKTFSDLDFKEYFAVKALPNPSILKILHEEGCGFDCSSVPELKLARQVGARGEEIFFTSNNSSEEEFFVAQADGSAIINLDDIALLEKLYPLPDLLSFRVNIGTEMGNSIIGNPFESKFGIPREKILEAYRIAQSRGIKHFGLHTMMVSNELDYRNIVLVVEELLSIKQELAHELNIVLEFMNIGGGLGIPYRPEQEPLDLLALVSSIKACIAAHGNYQPNKWYLESGRYITGKYGVLVSRAINRKESYRTYIGLDASMSALMRPAMYGAYHHIEVLGKETEQETEMVDIVGALCENNDKFAIQRQLPTIQVGDLLIIQDTGAHGLAMGFNYNGRLRPQELLLHEDGNIELIRRAETIDDYFATLNFEEKRIRL